MGYWNKHQKKEGQALLEMIDRAGWRIIDGKGYYKARCPCGRHAETVHHSPSDPNYWLNKRMKFQRTECWRKVTP